MGQKEKGNGAVILVKPKKGTERGQVNISPGYGMEQYVTDATAKRIIDREMIPAFREDDYYTGIDNAVNTSWSIFLFPALLPSLPSKAMFQPLRI